VVTNADSDDAPLAALEEDDGAVPGSVMPPCVPLSVPPCLIHVPPPDENLYHDPSHNMEPDTEWSRLLTEGAGVVSSEEEEEEEEEEEAGRDPPGWDSSLCSLYMEPESTKSIRLIVESRGYKESGRPKPVRGTQSAPEGDGSPDSDSPKVPLRYKHEHRVREWDRPALWSDAAKTIDSIQTKHFVRDKQGNQDRDGY